LSQLIVFPIAPSFPPCMVCIHVIIVSETAKVPLAAVGKKVISHSYIIGVLYFIAVRL